MIHPTAEVHWSASVPTSCKVWSGAVIGANAKLGENCIIGSCCYVGQGSILGNDVHLNHGTFLPNNSKVGDRVFFGPNVTCTDDRHPKVNNADYKAEPPVFEFDCSIGANVTILPGVTVGHSAMIGAGAVVTHDVEPYITVVGCPAIPLSAFTSSSDIGLLRKAYAVMLFDKTKKEKINNVG